MDDRLKYESLMRRAFRLSHRKEVYFADADFFDMENEPAISAVMTAALYLLKKEEEDKTNRDWLESAIEKLSQSNDWGTISRILSELPVKYQ